MIDQKKYLSIAIIAFIGVGLFSIGNLVYIWKTLNIFSRITNIIWTLFYFATALYFLKMYNDTNSITMESTDPATLGKILDELKAEK